MRQDFVTFPCEVSSSSSASEFSAANFLRRKGSCRSYVRAGALSIIHTTDRPLRESHSNSRHESNISSRVETSIEQIKWWLRTLPGSGRCTQPHMVALLKRFLLTAGDEAVGPERLEADDGFG